MATRSGLGMKLEIGDLNKFDFSAKDVCGVAFQYPNTNGDVTCFADVAKRARAAGPLPLFCVDRSAWPQTDTSLLWGCLRIPFLPSNPPSSFILLLLLFFFFFSFLFLFLDLYSPRRWLAFPPSLCPSLRLPSPSSTYL